MEVLEPSEFLAEAQALAVGEKRKVRHLCGDASLVVYNNVDSWTGWCWRCHARGWVAKPQPSMAERLQRQRQQESIDNALRSDVQAPRPANHDFGSWPLAARLWLLKAGLTPQLVKQLGAYYHAGSDRVVLPVSTADGQVIFWQARNCNYPADGRPKYISDSRSVDSINAFYPRQDATGEREASTLVLTEDILSAFKVAASGAGDALALMGTVCSASSLAFILSLRHDEIRTWFDADSAGTSARRSVGRTLSFVGRSVRHITTTNDPKHYCLREIREHLQ